MLLAADDDYERAVLWPLATLAQVHKVDPIPPDLERKVRAAIRDER